MASGETGLGSRDPEERRRAVADIAKAPDADQSRLLIAALGDPDWRVRKEAVGIAPGLPASRAVLEALVKAFEPGDNVGLRNAAVEALTAFGSRAVEAIGSAMPGLDADGRKLAAEALSRTGDPGALRQLEELLDDDDVNVRAAAIEAIPIAGRVDVERAVTLLERCLVSQDALAVLGALEGLNRLGAPVGFPLLRPHVEDPLFREAALVAAGLSGHVDAAPHLARWLATAEGRTRRSALHALATFVGDDPAARRAARTALGGLEEKQRRRLVDEARRASDDLEARRCVLLIVGVLGTSEAAEAVIDALADDRVASEAERALEMLGPAAILALSRRARAGSSQERAACVEQLGRLADESSRAIASQAILDATEDGAPDVVRAALGALRRIGDEGTFGLATRFLLPDSSPALRQAAALALAATATRYPEASRALARQCRPDADDAVVAAVIMTVRPESVFGSVAQDVAFLADAASNQSGVARRAAFDALSRFEGAAAIEAVSFGITDEAPEVQLAAIRALGRMRDENGRAAGVGHLLEVVGNVADDAVGVAAIEALGDTNDPGALDVLRGVARQGTAVRAVAAVEALSRLDAPDRTDALIHALSRPEPEVVKAALRAVARDESNPRVMAHVASCLDHEAWDVRRLAAELLGRRADARDLLRQRLVHEREALVREEIQRSLSEGEGTPVRRTMPPLGGGAG